MTEADRLRAQADRCTQLAHQITDHAVADALTGLAAKSLEQACELDRLTFRRRQK